MLYEEFNGALTPPPSCPKTFIPLKLAAVDTEFDINPKEVVAVEGDEVELTEDEEKTLVSVQLSDGKERYFYLWDDHKEALTAWLEDASCKKIFHKAYADILQFKKVGVNIQGLYADTLIMDWAVDENRRRHGLKSCVYDYFGCEAKEYDKMFLRERVGKTKAGKPRIEKYVPLASWLVEHEYDLFVDYASMDAYMTYWLFVYLRKQLKSMDFIPGDSRKPTGESMWDVYRRYDTEFSLALVDMAVQGVAVDKNVLKEIGTILARHQRCYSRVFHALAPDVTVIKKKAGIDTPVVIEGDKLLISSVPQMAALFYDTLNLRTVDTKWVRGKSVPDDESRCTDATHLEAWAGQGSVLALMLKGYRNVSTQLNTFIGAEGASKGLLSKIDPDGRIRTELKQEGTVTGRLASSAPNLQNIPADKSKDVHRIRRAFVPDSVRHRILCADYSMIEIRLIAHFSRDKCMVTALRNGIDLHSRTAKNCFNLPCAEEEVKALYGEERKHAKVINFGIQYGMKPNLLMTKLGCTYKQAEKYIDTYFETYPGVYIWIQRTIEYCREHGFVTTLLGHRRNIPEIHSDKQGERGHAENQAMNAPIQGSAADIIKLAMIAVRKDQRMQELGLRVALQVHDELVCSVPEDTAEEARLLLIDTMCNAYGLIVPIEVEAKLGDNWDQAK